MIKFIPQTTAVKSPLSDMEGYANNQRNKSVASQLETRFKEVLCKEHPHKDSTILFDFKDKGDSMTVQSYCCPTFKEILDLIATEQYPLPPKKE